MQQKNPITCEPNASQIHPELYHYTGKTGLKGIYENNQLFAKHYQYLNDQEEIVSLKSTLISNLESMIKDFIIREQRLSLRIRTKVHKNGGANKIAKLEAKRIFDNIYEATFGSVSMKNPLFSPYISSFCSHNFNNDYEKENGLLSQWRGYGDDGRFAIVFDTMELEKILQKEESSYRYSYITLSEVIYNDEYIMNNIRIQKIIDEAFGIVKSQIEGTEIIPPEINNFLSTACRVKHQGFREEREVRIIATPVEREHLDAEVLRDETNKPLKLSEHTERGPIIRLFQNLRTKKLPIKRIIIGPHREQDENYAFAKTVVQGTIPVIRSKTPYREHPR